MSKGALRAGDAALLLMDHQVGVMSWIRSASLRQIKLNAVQLAQTASALQMPVVITTHMEHAPPGALIEELSSILPQECSQRIHRLGAVKTLNGMDDENLAASIDATTKRQLVVAGAALNVTVELTVRSLTQEGYQVHLVTDAGGWPGPEDHERLQRLQSEGVTLLTTRKAVAQLVGIRIV